MKFVAYYFYYWIIDFFAASIVCGIVGAAINDTLGAILYGLSFFSIFIIAGSQANKRVYSEKEQGKAKHDHSSYGGVRIVLTTSGYDDEERNSTSDATWIGKGESLDLSGYKISDPMMYIENSGKKSYFPHVIQQKLKVSKEDDGSRLGYWPSYSDITPSQRGVFLRWLEGGKCDPNIDVGYVFIYFYGLEYRVLKHGKDYDLVARELVRLYEIYESNNSFRSYSEGLLAYTLSKIENKIIAQEIYTQIKPKLNKYSIIYRAGINLLLKDSKKITSDEVISLVPGFEDIGSSIIPSKVGPCFDQYFYIIAKEEIEEAISTVSPKAIKERYYAASSCLGQDFSFNGQRVVINKGLQRKLGKKWVKAIEDFKPYSRKLSKQNPEEIFNLLPLPLRSSMNHPNKDLIENNAHELLDRPIELSQIALKIGVELSEKINLKECRKIVEVLHANNLIIEPDIIYFKKSYKGDDKFMVSKVSQINELEKEGYRLAALLADLGVDLAYSDGSLSDSEANKIYSILCTNFLTKDIEKEHLKLRLKLYKEFKPKISSTSTKLFETLSLNELKILSDFLINVALVDGVFTKAEDKKIRGYLAKIGLEESYIKDLYQRFGINEISDNVELKTSVATLKSGSAIPKPNQNLQFDKEKLAQLAEDTAKVRSVLSQIIKTDEDEQEDIKQVTIEDEAKDLVLDDDHLKFLDLIIGQGEWSKKELREKSKEMGLMMNSAISKINEWAEAKYGDFLIFEEDTFVVQADIVKEVKSCA